MVGNNNFVYDDCSILLVQAPSGLREILGMFFPALKAVSVHCASEKAGFAGAASRTLMPSRVRDDFRGIIACLAWCLRSGSWVIPQFPQLFFRPAKTDDVLCTAGLLPQISLNLYRDIRPSYPRKF